MTGGARNVPITDPRQTYADLREATDRAVLDVLASGQYALGEQVSAFEAEVAEYLGTPHAIGVASGTEALLLALSALDVGPGDEVVTTAYSFIASATCIARLGATPVFVDIDPDTYQMDPAGLARAITPRTRAVIAVHLYGYAAPLDAYQAVLDEHEEPIALIEDAAQAIGTVCRVGPERRAAKAGTVGIWGCYSFYPTKNLPACGEGGLMVTPQPVQAERGRQLRNHGMDAQYHHALLAGNGRLSALQAAVLRVRLPHLESWNDVRRSNAALYDQMFADSGLPSRLPGFSLPPKAAEGEIANYHQYTLRVPRRDGLNATLREKGINAGVYYPLALPFQPVFRDLGAAPGSFPESEKASQEVLCLPIHQHLTRADVERVASEIIEFYR